MVRMTEMMVTMVVLGMAVVVLMMAKVVKLTDSRPCSVPYGSGSVFNSTVRPELQRIDQNLIKFSKSCKGCQNLIQFSKFDPIFKSKKLDLG